jgi:3-oxoacyl-[acyl-carrier-protein] synthase II
MILENYRSAMRRNAPVYAEIAGYANRTDGHHLTQPHLPSQITTMHTALRSASLTAGQVDYVNAHGTSTTIGDRIEAEAIRTVFGDRPVPVSALKSMTGHMLAGSAAFEIACTAMSIRDSIIPPTINVTERDPECRISLATKQIIMPIRAALTQSFGFGGANAVLVLKRHF